ncbi:MAG: hypothetical protein ABIO06_07065 [Pseudolysinimonas sp.]
MAPTPEQTLLAADPATDAQTLADLAHAEPELWPTIAAHPNAHPDLIEWMHEHGLAETALTVSPAPESATLKDGPGRAEIQIKAPAASTQRVSVLRAGLIAAAAFVVVLALVLVGWSSYATVSALVQGHQAAAEGSTPSSATDYRFGAAKTWQTKVKVVASASEGFAGYYARVQAYPGLWLVTWPGDDSGSGRLTEETLLGLDPDTGAVKWSISPALLECASSLAGGALVCVDIEKAALVVLDPSTGKATHSPLNGVRANSVDSIGGDIVLGYESPNATGITETVKRLAPGGRKVWEKSASCDGQLTDDGMQVSSNGARFADQVPPGSIHSHETLLLANCLVGIINLDSGVLTSDVSINWDGCYEGTPTDLDAFFFYGTDLCSSSKYPLIIARGGSTLAGMTLDTFLNSAASEQPIPTVWSADIAGASLDRNHFSGSVGVHLGSYALLASAGHLYGVDTRRGPRWEQSTEFSGDSQVVLLPIDGEKANSPVLALEADHQTIMRLDPGSGATRVSAEPAALPACPEGQTPVSFSTWDKGKGATLVCQGFARTVTVVLIVRGKTYTSASGSITPTGYRADFGGGLSVDIGLGGWAAWVVDGQTTTLHAASGGWQIGDVAARAYPAMNDKVEACPIGSYPLSLSTWHGGWLLTCGRAGATITKFVYVDGSSHGSGGAMTTQGGLSCGTAAAGVKVCVSASPAVVAFSSKGGPQTQHSVDANYVAGQRFGGAGQGTGAYGLADPAANAASQVAYLNGILQQSEAARTSVKTVIRSILHCTSTTGDVQNAQAVVEARTTELQALNSAPVDAVPGGAQLVAQLQAVLQDSLTADIQYVTAAGQVAQGQCAAGKSTYAAQQAFVTQITNEKTALANLWNGQIASQYGTPTYTQDDI